MCNPPVCVYIVYTLGSGYRRKRRCRHVKSTDRNSRDEIVFEHSGASESHIHIRQVYTTLNTTYMSTYTICMLSISITIYHNVRRVHNGDLSLGLRILCTLFVSKTPHARDTTRGAYYIICIVYDRGRLF